jgi:hypothetical protein
MFGDYGYDIGTEMGKELDYLTKLYLVKAFNVRKNVYNGFMLTWCNFDGVLFNLDTYRRM